MSEFADTVRRIRTHVKINKFTDKIELLEQNGEKQPGQIEALKQKIRLLEKSLRRS